MKLYVWRDDGGWGAAALVVLAEDLEQARALAALYQQQREAEGKAKTQAYADRTQRGLHFDAWLETDEGRAWSEMPGGDDLMADFEKAPADTMPVTAPGVVSSMWYYE